MAIYGVQEFGNSPLEQEGCLVQVHTKLCDECAAWRRVVNLPNVGGAKAAALYPLSIHVL